MAVVMTALVIPPTSVKFFFGRISRDEAEQVLKNRGCQEGLYLLRESMTTAGNYALSICHQSRIHHYSIERQTDGAVMIQDGKKFKGPVELVQHHERVLDGFLTRPTKACERHPEQQPMAWPGVTMLELEQCILEKAEQLCLRGAQLENMLGPNRQSLVQMVARELHKEQPWFHGRITRDGADEIMKNDGHRDGKFLVRERDDKSYALSLSYRSLTKHYKIDKHKSDSRNGVEKLAIEDGPRFESLMDMIGHYHNKTDGLLCKLTKPCQRLGFKKKPRAPGMSEWSRIYGLASLDQANTIPFAVEDGPEYTDNINPQASLASSSTPAPTSTTTPAPPVSVSLNAGGQAKNRTPPIKPPRNPKPPASRQISFEQKLNDPAVRAQGIIGNEHVQNAIWDDPDIPEADGEQAQHMNPQVQTDPPPLVPRQIEEDPQIIYDSVPRTEEVFNLNKKDLELHDKLGAGNFGSVMRGQYCCKDKLIPVAIKTLKQDDIPNAEGAIMKEARVMAGLQHRNIVRLIGVCRSDTIMLVMELAPLGQLSKYLKKHVELHLKTVLELMFQVAEGMAYLESKNFVHRDLAARNVLLVNERFAKISDFGMSKALGFGNNYYQAEAAGKWPLKWYAPECIYYFKFDSKSDIWSYGVTLWEALSYGAKPYKGLKGQQILELIESGRRLEKPNRCPPGVYDIMMRCWTYDKKDRPSFKDLVEALRKYKQ